MSGPPPPYNAPPGQFYPDGQQPYNPQFQGPVQTQPGWAPPPPPGQFQAYPGQAQPGYQPGYQQPYVPQQYPPQQPHTVVVHECHDDRRHGQGISDEQCCCIALLGACCLACCLSD